MCRRPTTGKASRKMQKHRLRFASWNSPSTNTVFHTERHPSTGHRCCRSFAGRTTSMLSCVCEVIIRIRFVRRREVVVVVVVDILSCAYTMMYCICYACVCLVAMFVQVISCEISPSSLVAAQLHTSLNTRRHADTQVLRVLFAS